LPGSVRAVDRALDILLCFSQEKSVLSLTEIADHVGISKSTVHRLLATLESKRFLFRNSATGKYHLGFCFLAFLPQERVNQILASPLTLFTEETPLVLENLRMDLDETRLRGFAISEQKYEKDINAVAAPILSADGYPIAAIAIAGPSFRLPRQRMLSLGRTIQQEIVSINGEVGLTALSVLVPRHDPLN
jgi:DNA-binding IclR family transcriptional regulator